MAKYRPTAGMLDLLRRLAAGPVRFADLSHADRSRLSNAIRRHMAQHAEGVTPAAFTITDQGQEALNDARP